MFENRLRKLISIKKDRDWEETLSSNYSEYEQYRKLITENNIEDAQKKFNKLLPAYYEVFHLINQDNIDNEILDMSNAPYDIGILLLGYSIMPLILSIAEIRPKNIIFVVTDDTECLVKEIKDGVRTIAEGYYSQVENRIEAEKIVDLSDPAAIFKTIELLIQNNKGKKIAIDITGGKKTMVAGSFLASAQSRICDIFYVDFEEYSRKNSEPVYGTEFMAKLPNPSEIFSLADWDRLISLKENYQFQEAVKELERIEDNVKKFKEYFGQESQRQLTEMKMNIQGFGYWDDYQYDEALKNLPGEPALEKLSKGKNEAQIYGDMTLLTYYLLDRLENAKRRKKQGQLQGAFLRFESLIEFTLMLWAKKSLHEEEINKYKGIARYFTHDHLLKYLKDNSRYICNDIVHHDLKALQRGRNNHILIHSMNVIDTGMVDKAEKCAEQIIWNLLEHKGMSREEFDRINEDVVF